MAHRLYYDLDKSFSICLTTNNALQSAGLLIVGLTKSQAEYWEDSSQYTIVNDSGSMSQKVVPSNKVRFVVFPEGEPPERKRDLLKDWERLPVFEKETKKSSALSDDFFDFLDESSDSSEENEEI